VSIAAESGLYTSESAFIADAIRTLLAARPDVRVTIACQLYARGFISIGKAAELSGLDIEELKAALYERGISRMATEDAAETQAMVAAALKTLRS
jgi:predicted HTH domain antitoxin